MFNNHEGYNGYFLCPDYNLICSGTVMCNDMFDCVDKKSEIKKDSYIYDYQIKTSQNIENAETSFSDNETNYELSENGICPINCKHCLLNNKCLECRNDFGLIGSKENEEIKCLSLDILNKGYYQYNNIYYTCIENCDICSNNITCDNCSLGFSFFNGKCINSIENCQIYLNENICNKCKENYAFKEDNRTICLNKNNFDNYYTKDEGISYYPCENEITNCSKCYYDINQNKTKCFLCNNNNSFLIIGKDICLSRDKINQTYFYINETHINKCSNSINNCEECENNNTCSRCTNDFYMINGDNYNCINKSLISSDEYYLNDNKTIYFSCYNSIYQDIKNCKKCSSKNNCTFCQENYTFIDGNKSICVEKETLINKYLQDPIDISNYIKCENIFNNCYTCNDSYCLSCKEGYIFINDNFSNCILKSSINLDDYFINDNIIYYYCKDEKYKNRQECQRIIFSDTQIIYSDLQITSTNTTSNESTNDILINSEITTLTEFSVDTTKNLTNITSIDYSIDIHIKNITSIPVIYSTGINQKSTKIISMTNQIEIPINSTNNTSTKSLDDMEITSILQTGILTSIIGSKIENKNPFYEILILQVRIIQKLLKVFVTISRKIEKFLSINISINVYKYKNIRNLQENRKIDLYINQNNNIEPGKIIVLNSKEEFSETDRIVLNCEKTSEYNMIVLNNNNKILDTKENEIMIQNGEILDLSQNSNGYEFNNYIIESSSKGCQFNLISKTTIKEQNLNIKLNFIEKNNNNNIINARCSLSNKNNNIIYCSLDDEVDNNYILDLYIGSGENGFFSITQDNTERTFSLNCSIKKKKESSKSKNIIVIIIAIILATLLITATIIVIICLIKRKKKKESGFKNHINISGSHENIKDYA